mgnify:CR=1 FL=1|tara:strand:+ start:7566 stop:7799 length:234 start_codon:yes stop_codon:yes gene_type:complete
MQKKKEKYKINKLTEFDTVEFRGAIRDLEKILKDNTISESSVSSLNSIITQLSLVRDNHVNSLISWLKQDYILEDED